jgi:hypothetical protein
MDCRGNQFENLKSHLMWQYLNILNFQIFKSPNSQIKRNMPLFSSRKEEKKVKVTFANGLLFVETGWQAAGFPVGVVPETVERYRRGTRRLETNR